MRPALLVRSGEGTPMWVSPLECQKLATGMSTFECCENNHTGLFSSCVRPTMSSVMSCMVRARAISLYTEGKIAEARFTVCFESWWKRGLVELDQSKNSRNISLEAFKTKTLRWCALSDGSWFDRERFSILTYAIVCNHIEYVRKLLKTISNRDEKHKFICSATPRSGLPCLGIQGGATALMGSMIFASIDIVSLLLEHDADPFKMDNLGNDSFMLASTFGRTENVKFWLKQFPDWDLERKNRVVGGLALGAAVYMGPRRLEIVKVLLDHGACLDHRTDTGGSVFTSLCSNEDADLEVLELLLKTNMRTSVNYRSHGRNTKWRIIYGLARFLTRNKLTKSGVMNAIATWSGSSALHFAVQRGDVDIVNLLLEHGADPTIKNDLGKSPVDYCDAFPELRGALKRVIQQRKEGKQVTLDFLRTALSSLEYL